jgi:hypothetical protein
MYQMYPSVECLQIHLPNTHRVRFKRDQMIAEVLDNERNKKNDAHRIILYEYL